MRPAGLVLIGMIAAAALASGCGDSTGPGVFRVPGDTVAGTGSVEELERQRARWQQRAPAAYRFNTQQYCFCITEVVTPARVVVRDDRVTEVRSLETGELLNPVHFYTIDQLFEWALAAARSGTVVSVAYDRELGFPARLTIGTPENDAGSIYRVANVTELR